MMKSTLRSSFNVDNMLSFNIVFGYSDIIFVFGPHILGVNISQNSTTA